MALDASTPAQTPLLAMPPEIRNAIYELVVLSEWGRSSQNFFVLDRPLPALFRVNRQIRSEALDVFLLKNHFHIYTCNIGLKWLDILGKDVVRFRFISLFIDLNLDRWLKYLNALLPFVSDYLELRIRKAAASLPDSRLETFLRNAGLQDKNRWVREEKKGLNEIVFKQIQP